MIYLNMKKVKARRRCWWRPSAQCQEPSANVIEDRFGPMTAAELVECLAVGDDEPLLRAVVHVLHRESLKLSGSAGGMELPAEQAKGLSMAAGAVEDACDELLRLVEVARRRVQGAAKDGQDDFVAE